MNTSKTTPFSLAHPDAASIWEYLGDLKLHAESPWLTIDVYKISWADRLGSAHCRDKNPGFLLACTYVERTSDI